jgi:hypothetical protein
VGIEEGVLKANQTDSLNLSAKEKNLSSDVAQLSTDIFSLQKILSALKTEK